MTTDVVALCARCPDVAAVLAALLAAGADLTVRSVSAGALLQVRVAQGGALFAVEGPRLVQVPGEIERLLGAGLVGVPAPVWWVEARALDTVPSAAALARRLGQELVTRSGGVLWP